MTFANPLPWWAGILVIAGAAALAWHAYRAFSAPPVRRYVLSGLRFATLLLLVVFLMRPVSHFTTADSRDVIVPILVDVSRSMAIEDASRGRRIDRAREFLENGLLPALKDRFQVEILSFGEAVRPADAASLSPTARRTDLAGALAAARERYRGRPVAGMVLLSDGGDTSGMLAAAVAETTLPPVHAFGFGSEAGRDREVLSVTVAEAVLDESRVDLAVSAVEHGGGTDAVELRLLENGRPREVRHVRPGADGGPIREVFQVAPAVGAATVYSVEIPHVAGELVPENNTRSVLVQPPSRARRVLLVEGAPGFEHTFLKRALTADRSLEVDSVVRQGKNEQGADTYYIQASRARSAALSSGFPSEQGALFAYDTVVLANVGGDQLSGAQMESVRDFVGRRGGGLLVMGAQSFLGRGLVGTPVEDALPMLLNRRTDTALPTTSGSATGDVALTDAGAEHPVTRIGSTLEDSRKRWGTLPSLASASALGSARPGATILATTTAGGAARPLIAVQRYGEGRSMVFAGEAAWRWRMMMPSTDRSYETFWRQAIRWLALGATDPVTVFPPQGAGVGDEVSIRIAVRDGGFNAIRDADVDVRISAPDGRLHHVRASAEGNDGPDSALFSAKFTPDGPGLHRISVSVRTAASAAAPPAPSATAFIVGGADVEMTDPRLNAALLERISASTGGRLHDAAEIDGLIAALRAATPASVLSIRQDLWHNARSFVLIIGLLTAEWIFRRRWGLR